MLIIRLYNSQLLKELRTTAIKNICYSTMPVRTLLLTIGNLNFEVLAHYRYCTDRASLEMTLRDRQLSLDFQVMHFCLEGQLKIFFNGTSGNFYNDGRSESINYI